MAEIRWSHEAAQWLKEIYEYIAQDNPTAAGKVVSGIYEKAQFLSEFPKIGYKYRDEPEGEVRILLYGALPDSLPYYRRPHRYSGSIPRGIAN